MNKGLSKSMDQAVSQSGDATEAPSHCMPGVLGSGFNFPQVYMQS